MVDKLKILILEDVPADAELMERELRKGGIKFSTKRVDTRKAFLKELKDFEPDIILGDYKLPSFDGLSALEIAQKKLPDVPFIFVSATIGEELAIETLKRGATDYVLKDRLSRLVPAVDRALRDVEERAELKKAEEALRQNEATLRALINVSTDSILLLDSRGVILDLNEIAAERLGKSSDDLIGTLVDDSLPEDIAKRRRSIISQIFETGREARFEDERDGIWYDTVAHPIIDKDGAVNRLAVIARDITERKQAEEILRTERDKAQHYLDIAEVILVALNIKGEITLINRKGNQILGYQEGELVGKDWFTICLPLPFRKDIKAVFLKLMTSKGKISEFYENPIMTKSGAERIIAWHNTLLKDAQGNIIGALSSGEDITERRQAEEALRESEIRLRMLFEAIPDSIIIHDEEGNILHINEIGAQQLEWSAKDLEGRNLREIVTPENAASIADHIKETKKVGRSMFETTFVARSGWRILSEVNERPIKFGKGKAILSIARDTTERKRAEEALRESEDRYRSLFENSEDAILLTSPEGSIFKANPAACRMFGRTEAEIIQVGRNGVVDLTDPRLTIGLEERKRTGRFRGELTFLRGDGQPFPAEVTSVVFQSQDGQPRSSMIIRDITERKRAEEEIISLAKFPSENPNPVLRLGQDGTILYANKASQQLLQDWGASIGSQASPLWQKIVAQALVSKSKSTIEVSRKDRVYSFVVAPILDSGYINLYGRDITERKQAEEKLRESEERFRTIFESAEDKIYIKDRNLRFTFVNPAQARIHGTTPSKLIGKTSKDLFGEERSAKIMEDDLRVLGGEIVNKEEPSPIKGSSDIIHLIKVPLRNSAGEIVGLCGIARDITERKQAEEELRNSESRYRTLFDSASDAIFILDPTTRRFTDANQVACERLGYSREELLQMTPLDIDSPEYAPLVRERIETLRQRGQLFFETAHVRRDGTVIPTEVSSRTITYAGKPALLSIARDITERKQAEEELRRGYNQMREMLITTVNALAATVEMKDQYTAGHQPRATQLACAIATEMGLAEEQIEGIRMAASVHDIGKIVVPAEILNKPGPLTEVQYEMVKMHPRAGYDVLKEIKFPWPVAQIVLQHHELMDGTGYPQGLSGEEIIVEARILTVANVVEAMSSHRPYRPAHSISEALEEISRNRGKLYDPRVVDACLKLFAEKRFTFD